MLNYLIQRGARLLLVSLSVSVLLLGSFSAQAQDVILQGFYWNTHPGDHSDGVNGGIWWDTLATVAPEVAAAGFSTVWTPPMTKGYGGRWDMGYGLYDYYDLGEYDQKFSVRTRHGNRAQFDNMMQALHAEGLKVMGDLVLNHRGGADGQQSYEVPWSDPNPWTIFNPASGRFPGVPGHFHPNSAHPNQDGSYREAIFFEDICYFNSNDMVGPPGGWYFGAPVGGLGHAGDSLIAWGRWLMNDVGFDEMRIDAVKHIDPGFLSKFLVEVNNGPQPFAVGEFFDFSASALAGYQNAVETNGNSGTKQAEMSIFDFDMRADLKSILDNTSGSGNLYTTLGQGGMIWGEGASGFDVVTFLDNHDKDRVGFIGGSSPNPDGTCPAGEIKAGNSCVKIDGFTAADHDPVIHDKEDMGYPMLMAMEGRPTVFWKDFYWFGLKEEITWVMTLRASQATGGSSNSTLQNEDVDGNNDPNWDPGFGGNCNGGNMFAMQRWGTSLGSTDGMVLGLNDHPTDELGMYVNTPFSNKTLKDYSDGYMFVTVNAPVDSRTLIRAQPRDYSWWSLTGLYPTPPGEAGPAFTLDAQPGGQVQYVIIDQDDAANLLVNGQPIEAGDQVAVVSAAGEVYGIGRVGQGFGWKPGYDMLIEVLGAFPDGTPNGMTAGETLNLAVYDASTGNYYDASSVSFAANNTSATFNALRPQTPNRPASFTMSTNTGGSTYAVGSIARITQFDASSPTTTFPVEWLSVDAQVERQDILLSWTVGSETNNRGFAVELQGEREFGFEAVAFVPGAADHQEVRSYSHRLRDLAPGRYRLRLRQEDLDGQTRYSQVLDANVLAPGFGTRVVPNPNQGHFSVYLDMPTPGMLQWQVFDQTGRLVQQQRLDQLSAGQHELPIAMEAMPAGLYTLRLSNGYTTEVQRFQVR